MSKHSAPHVSKFRRLRKAAGLTQIQLSEASGVHVQKIRRIEGGEIDPANLTLKNALALATALGVRPDEFLGDDTPEAAAPKEE